MLADPSLPITRSGERTAEGGWSAWSRDPDPRLKPGVLGYAGFTSTSRAGVLRRELPGPLVPLIISFDAPYRMQRFDERDSETYDAFCAGLTDRAVIVASGPRERCIQIDFTPLGARRFLRLPMHLIARGTFQLGDLLGALAAELTERLHDAPDWASRFALIDEVLLARSSEAEPTAAEVTWAWDRIVRARGNVRVGELTEQLGWSRRRLAEAFRTEIGLTAKPVTRVLRFQEARRRLEAGDSALGTAFASGFADQSHMVREFVDLAGITPLELSVGAAASDEQIFNPVTSLR